MPLSIETRYFLLALLPLLACGSKEPDARPMDSGGAGGMAAGGTPTSTSGSDHGGTPSVSGGGMTGSGGATGGTSGATGKAGAATAGKAGGSEPEGAAGACEAADPEASFEDNCVACAASDCEHCLCTDCSEPVQNCATTSGCPEIAACIRESQCAGVACYCGTFDALACAAGQSDGPCKAVILGAPGGREPTLISPSAGPASDAAVAIAACMEPGGSCAAACPASQ